MIRASDAPGLIGKMEEVLNANGLDVKNVGIQKDLSEKKVEITLMTDSPAGLDLDAVTKAISSVEQVENIDIE